jgi:hypothetical protein
LTIYEKYKLPAFFEMAPQTMTMDTHFGIVSQLFLFVKYPTTKQNKLGRSVGFGSLAAIIVPQRKK